MTAAKSAYPVPVDELLPQARELASELGRTPSRNQLMSTLRVGAPKAREILARLAEEGPTEAANSGLSVVTMLNPADSEPTEPDVDETEVTRSGPTEMEGSTELPESVRQGDSEPITTAADLVEPTGERSGSALSAWPVLLLSLPAFVAIWSGWVGLGELTGFGLVHPLPGIADGFALNTAITLPIGMETYAAYALRVWMSGQIPPGARRFAKYSALGSLLLGGLGQIAFHLMKAAGMSAAPWPITALVACLPVGVLGMGAALVHLIRDNTVEVRR